MTSQGAPDVPAEGLLELLPLLVIVGALVGLERLAGSSKDVRTEFRVLLNQALVERTRALETLLHSLDGPEGWGGGSNTSGPAERFWYRMKEISQNEHAVRFWWRMYGLCRAALVVLTVLGVVSAVVALFWGSARLPLIIGALVTLGLNAVLLLVVRALGGKMDSLGDLAMYGPPE